MRKEFDNLNVEIEIRKEFNYEVRSLTSEVYGTIIPKVDVDVRMIDVLGCYRIYDPEIDSIMPYNRSVKMRLCKDQLYVIQLLSKNDFLSNKTIDDVNTSKTLKDLILNVIDCGFVTFPKKVPFSVK